MNKNPSIVGGLILIGLGVLFLINSFIPIGWPVVLIAIGAVMLALAFSASYHWTDGLGISGLLNAVIGVILLYQSLSQDWESWYYLWPLIFAAVGAGMLLNRWLVLRRRPEAQMGGARFLRVFVSFLVLGLLAAGALWVFRDFLTWTVILWGMGALFLLLAVAGGVAPLVIPGVILAGLGLLLEFQRFTGYWESWAFAWTLIPGLVGFSLFLAFLRSRVMRAVGLLMLGWSMVAFVLFGVLFAGGGQFARFWPFVLVMAGLVILAQSLLTPRRLATR